MNMDNKGNSALDQELALRFSRLRDQDREQLPPFPALEERLHVKSVPGRSALVGSLAAAVLVSIGAALFVLQPTQDPADLYVAIMQKNTVTTDHLLWASPGILPESDLLPALYELNFSESSIE